MDILPEDEQSLDGEELCKVDEDEEDKKLLDEALLEALLAQNGQDEWWKLSEKERQQRLMEMRLRERKIRKEGKRRH